MYGLTAENIMVQFPEALKDGDTIQAMGETIAAALAAFYPETDTPRLYPRINMLPEATLDLLAAELGTPFYDSSLSEGTKRTLLWETILYYKRAGTVGAVNRILRAVFPGSHTEEWFQYGGEPFHFRIRAYNHGGVQGVENLDEMVRLVRSVKRHAAHLESVLFTADAADVPLYLAAAAPTIIVTVGEEGSL